MCPELDPRYIRGFKSPDRILGAYPKKILLAYSGGADSSLLLALLAAWCKKNSVRLFAAHVNHSIRGDEALRDRDFCVKSAEMLGVKCFILDADVPSLAKERKKGIEETARAVRYEFFRKIMDNEGIEVLATAHNADDNLETVIFRMARGSGGKGLCGIPEKRPLGDGKTAIRPILTLNKKEILDICEKNGIKYVCDSTNGDDVYSRNRIRLRVIPELEKINPSVRQSAARLSALLSEDCDFIEAEAKGYLSEPNFNRICNLRTLHSAVLRRVLSAMICRATDAMPEFIHYEALSALISEGRPHSSVSLPGNVDAVIDFDRLIIRDRKRQKTKDESIPLPHNSKPLFQGDNSFHDFILNIDFTPNTHKNQTDDGNIYKLFTQASVSSDKIVGRLSVRSREPGDRIRVGGMSRDARKLISKARIPLCERDSYPMVSDGVGILWIPGVALRDGAADGSAEPITLSCRKNIKGNQV